MYDLGSTVLHRKPPPEEPTGLTNNDGAFRIKVYLAHFQCGVPADLRIHDLIENHIKLVRAKNVI